MTIKNTIGIEQILQELGVSPIGSDGIYSFDAKDKFFVGEGCEVGVAPTLDPDKPIRQIEITNIAICSMAS